MGEVGTCGDFVIRAKEPTVLGSMEFYQLRSTDLFLPFSVDTAIVIPGSIDVGRLEDALACVLARFPLYAGRIERVGGRWRVRLSNDGALLHVRQSQAVAPPVRPDSPIVLAPFHLALQINQYDFYSGNSQQAVLKLTLTLGPTWCSIGFSSSHVVGDGYVVAQFMRAVSTAYQNLRPEGELSYYYPEITETVSEDATAETPWLDRHLPLPSVHTDGALSDTCPRTMRVDIGLSAQQLSQIRTGILALSPVAGKPVSLSIQDCLVSALAVAISRAYQEHNEPPITRVTTIVNYRGVGPIPLAAACNALIQAVADLPSASSPFSSSFAYDLASSIRQSLVLSRKPEHVQAHIAISGPKFVALANATPPLSMDGSPAPGAMNVNSTRPFDWTSAHFGYQGKARFYHTCSQAPRYVKIFTPNPTLLPDGSWVSHHGAAEVVFYLEAHLREPFLREFAILVRELGVDGGPDYVSA